MLDYRLLLICWRRYLYLISIGVNRLTTYFGIKQRCLFILWWNTVLHCCRQLRIGLMTIISCHSSSRLFAIIVFFYIIFPASWRHSSFLFFWRVSLHTSFAKFDQSLTFSRQPYLSNCFVSVILCFYDISYNFNYFLLQI